jgi:hypothetical protein
MIGSREKRNRRRRRGTRRAAPRDRRDEPLRVLVRTLARQAARELFARELAMQIVKLLNREGIPGPSAVWSGIDCVT